jgi:hypothetical protein
VTSEVFDEQTVPSADLYRFRGERDGKEGVGRELRDVFLGSWGGSERMVRDLRMPLLRLCFRARGGLERRGSGGKMMGRDEDWIREFRKGKTVSGSGGYTGSAWDTWRD